MSRNKASVKWLLRFGFVTTLFVVLSVCVSAQEFAKEDKVLSRKAFKEFTRENFSEARSIYLDLIKKYPDDFEINYYLGACYLNTRYQKTKAIPYLVKVVEQGENSIPAVVHKDLGDLYHLDYQFEKAIYHYKRYQKLADKYDDFYEDVPRMIEICRNARGLIKDTLNVRIKKLRHPVNTGHSEYAPLISADDSVLFFTRRNFYTDEALLSNSFVDTSEQIYISFSKEGQWTEPERLVLTGVDLFEGVSLAGLSPDGQFVYVNAMVNGQQDIFVGRYDGDRTLDLKPLPEPINSDYYEGKVTVSADGNTLWFSSNRPGGVGGRDLYMAVKNEEGVWEQPENMGEPINTAYDDDAPYMHPSKKLLYYSSKGHNSMGGYDIFSIMLDEESVLLPDNLGFPINTTSDDLYFILTANGKSAYFSSSINNQFGNHDLYKVYLNLNIPLTLVKGTILAGEPLAPIPAKIRVVDNKTGEKLRYIYNPNPKTGHYLLIFPPGKNYDIIVEAEGYLAQNINVFIPNQETFYDLFQEIRLKPVMSMGKRVGEKLEVENVFFENGHPVDTTPEMEKDYSELFNLVESIIEGTDSLDAEKVEKRGFELEVKDETPEEQEERYDDLFGMLDQAFEEGNLDVLNEVQKEVVVPDRYKQVYFYDDDTNKMDLKTIVVGGDTLFTKPALAAYGELNPELIYVNELLDTSLISKNLDVEIVDTVRRVKAPEIKITPVMLRNAKEDQRKTVLKHQIFFEVGSATLPSDIQKELDEIAALLVNNNQLGLVLNGFADKTGDEQANKQLSQQRAFNLLEKLRSMGVNAERSIVRGYGESMATEVSKDKMKNERRVDVYVYELIQDRIE